MRINHTPACPQPGWQYSPNPLEGYDDTGNQSIHMVIDGGGNGWFDVSGNNMFNFWCVNIPTNSWGVQVNNEGGEPFGVDGLTFYSYASDKTPFFMPVTAPENAAFWKPDGAQIFNYGQTNFNGAAIDMQVSLDVHNGAPATSTTENPTPSLSLSGSTWNTLQNAGHGGNEVFSWGIDARPTKASFNSNQFEIWASTNHGPSNVVLTLSQTGTLTTTNFVGGGAGLTSLNASQITSGTLSTNQLPGAAISQSWTNQSNASGTGIGTNFIYNGAAGAAQNVVTDMTNDVCITGFTNGPGPISILFDCVGPTNHNLLIPALWKVTGTTNFISSATTTNVVLVITNGQVVTIAVKSRDGSANPTATNTVVFMEGSGN